MSTIPPSRDNGAIVDDPDRKGVLLVSVAAKTMIYVVRKQGEDIVRLGSGNGPRRIASHAQYGFDETMVLVWGDESDEKQLHSYFAPDRVSQKRRSWYGGERIFDWMAWLLSRGYAATTIDDLERIPRFPFSMWGPKEYATDEGHAGQMTILSALPASDRPRWSNELVHLSSESDEWFTPAELIDAAREVMGSIDTDPASHYEANRRHVHATIWYSKNQDGLRTDNPWNGNVWLNPPYGRGEGSAKDFIDRLVNELKLGTVTQAITCLNIASSTANWFLPVWKHASIHLVYLGRPDFWLPNNEQSTNSPSKGIILSYFGGNEEGFSETFGRLGTLVRTA